MWGRNGFPGPVLAPQRLGKGNVPILGAFVAAEQENHQLGPVVPKVDPVPGAVVDAALVHPSADRTRVYSEADFQLANSGVDPRPASLTPPRASSKGPAPLVQT